MTIRSSQTQHGFALVGALVLAVMVCVAASLAIRSSQHRILEARAKEGNIEARLALDSAASRILSQLDRVFEIKGAYGRQDLQQWLEMQQPSASGPYSVTLSATNDVVPEDKIVSTRTLAAAGLSKNTLDPLYPDFWMGQTNFSIDITARARRQGYPDFRARYGFRIRAVPVTEWAVFNPGRHREMVQLARDVSDTGHQAVHAYVGVVYSGGFSSGGTPASVTDASVSAANRRLWRTSGSAGGVAKYPNAASQGALSFKGDYPDYEPQWGSYELWGGLRDSSDSVVNNEVAGQYDDFLRTQDWSPDWVTPSFQPLQISHNNPLYDPNGQHAGDYVAVLNLADYLYTGSQQAMNALKSQAQQSEAIRFIQDLETKKADLQTKEDEYTEAYGNRSYRVNLNQTKTTGTEIPLLRGKLDPLTEAAMLNAQQARQNSSNITDQNQLFYNELTGEQTLLERSGLRTAQEVNKTRAVNELRETLNARQTLRAAQRIDEAQKQQEREQIKRARSQVPDEGR